jgi:hypothetical protein
VPPICDHNFTVLSTTLHNTPLSYGYLHFRHTGHTSRGEISQILALHQVRHTAHTHNYPSPCALGPNREINSARANNDDLALKSERSQGNE